MKIKIMLVLFLMSILSFSCKKTRCEENDTTAPTLKFFKLELVNNDVKVTDLTNLQVLEVTATSDFWIFIRSDDPQGSQRLIGTYTGKCGSILPNVDIQEPQISIDTKSPCDSVFVTRAISFHITGSEFFGACTDPANPIQAAKIGVTTANYSNVRFAGGITLNARVPL